MNIIETESLGLNYGRTHALENLTLSVPEGSVVACLGPNGAGKTTTIKIVMNLLRATSGTARVLGVDSRQLGNAEFERIGYVSENQQIPAWMTVGQYLRFCKPLYPAWNDAFAEKMLKQFDLPIDRKIKNLSRGMQMKAALLSSIAYYPRLLILDEPFSGLDPVVRDEFIQGILALTEKDQWTILISSHDIDEVERLADHVMLLDRGQLKVWESLDTLQGRFRRINLVTSSPPPLPQSRPSDWLLFEHSGNRVQFMHAAYSGDITESDIRNRFPAIESLTVEPLSMKEIYVTLAKTYRVSL